MTGFNNPIGLSNNDMIIIIKNFNEWECLKELLSAGMTHLVKHPFLQHFEFPKQSKSFSHSFSPVWEEHWSSVGGFGSTLHFPAFSK